MMIFFILEWIFRLLNLWIFGSVTLVMRNFGILIAYILGATIDYFQMPLVCISVPLVFMVLFFLLPNTPQYLLQKGNFKASISLQPPNIGLRFLHQIILCYFLESGSRFETLQRIQRTKWWRKSGTLQGIR